MSRSLPTPKLTRTESHKIMSSPCCGQLDAFPGRLAELETSKRWEEIAALKERAQTLIDGWKAYETKISTKLDKMSPTNHEDFLAGQHEEVKSNIAELTEEMHAISAVQLELRMDPSFAPEDVSYTWMKQLEKKFNAQSKTLGHSSIWWKLNFTLTKKH
ncbi:uncharacterized protein AB675_4117 [Cyphellophora attinorum]|uniref:Uncharacterized protein n=1 Tax=Cyphellophora attinorum TaxID=1664694 RepID=A0A0N1NYF8_9EURO|nr:uncharacterized protein AB675_4117 [Phialophora attinorum]KPI38583.1 hypothetical protein AB675_4117 [Phialophora attinorum]